MVEVYFYGSDVKSRTGRYGYGNTMTAEVDDTILIASISYYDWLTDTDRQDPEWTAEEEALFDEYTYPRLKAEILRQAEEAEIDTENFRFC